MQHLTHAPALSPSYKRARFGVLCVALALAGLLGYGLFTANRAQSATLAKKAFSGVKVSGGVPALVNPIHVTGVISLATGKYQVTFDRHVDNCALSTTVDAHGGGASAPVVFLLENGPSHGSTTSDEGVFAFDSATHAAVDTDFDIIALCPGT